MQCTSDRGSGGAQGRAAELYKGKQDGGGGDGGGGGGWNGDERVSAGERGALGVEEEQRLSLQPQPLGTATLEETKTGGHDASLADGRG